MLEQLTRKDFDARLDEDFVLRIDDGGALTLRLIEASPAGGRPPAGAREPFSIVLRGPAEHALAQGTYTMHNPTLGELTIFVVPIGPDAEGLCYEAVFN